MAGDGPFFTDFEEKYDVFPKIDIVDKDEMLLVRADVPGIRKEDLEITISGDRLVIEAKREFEEEEKKEEYVRHEMAYGRLYRTVMLPVEVLGEKVTAELKDGVLEVFPAQSRSNHSVQGHGCLIFRPSRTNWGRREPPLFTGLVVVAAAAKQSRDRHCERQNHPAARPGDRPAGDCAGAG